MKIHFVMDKRVNAGSIQAVANYVRSGDELGHTIAMYGRPDPRFPSVRFSLDLRDTDYVVFIIESGLHWMSGLRLPRILDTVPRSRRVILDADGMYNPVIKVDGYDRNHSSEERRLAWLKHYDLLACQVLQPTFAPLQSGARALPFYGYDAASQVAASAAPSKRFDIMHVGHNWWRWRDLSAHLLPAFERIRNQVDGICFVGAWWNGVPPSPAERELEQAFCIDNNRFHKLGIQVEPPVPYTRVIAAMSQGRINIMTQRPLFRKLKILTSKYFEIFAADTIPMVMLDPDHAELVYGPAGRHLALHGDVAGKLLAALQRPDEHREMVEAVRQHLVTHHSYRNRVQELVTALESAGATRKVSRAS
jgi:Glycosyl transferases group 1